MKQPAVGARATFYPSTASGGAPVEATVTKVWTPAMVNLEHALPGGAMCQVTSVPVATPDTIGSGYCCVLAEG